MKAVIQRMRWKPRSPGCTPLFNELAANAHAFEMVAKRDLQEGSAVTQRNRN